MIMPKHRHYFILYVFFFFALGESAFGQQVAPVTFSGDFTNITFLQLVNAIESKTSFHFYYDHSQTDSIRVNLTLQDKKVSEILDELFRSTDFHYAADASGNFFITKGRELQTSLPEDFFDTDKAKESRYNTALLDYLQDDKKEKARMSAESKIYEIGKRTKTIGTGNASLAGYVRAYESGEVIVGASVYIENPLIGGTTDQFGYYSLTLPKGRHDLIIKSLGSKNAKRQIVLYTDGKLNIEIQEQVTALKEVMIESEKDKNVASLQMGVNKIDIKTMKQIPGILGEADILRVVLALPGVQSVGEGSTGLNVRGGSASQNLILLNDATIYNPSHLFGFFSAFNPDVLKSAELYKSGIPAEFGGRISSVLDVTTREGNKKKIAGSGGISPITGRLTLEGPLYSEKSSFLIGFRSTYSDWLLKQIPNAAIANSDASFYDLNVSTSHEINERNSIYYSGYLSRDHFKLGGDSAYTYQNKTSSIKWKHVFNNKLYGVLTGSYSGYDYSVASTRNPSTAAQLSYSVNQSSVKADFSYFPNSKHSVNFGASSIYYWLTPGTYIPLGSASLVVPKTLENEQALESAIYVSDKYDLTDKISFYGGLRYSLYNYLGPHDVYTYASGLSKDLTTITGTIHYGSGKTIATYGGPEYRFSARYALPGSSSIKISYNKTRQYIQQISNTTSISPTDFWKLSDNYIKPQIGDQVALGYYRNFKSNTIEASIEGYYKTTQNTLDYKSGDSLLLNKHIETAVLEAHGKAYGVELLIKKTAGKLNGWFSYTYSRSFLRTNSPFPAENPNNGNYYPSNYDKPNAVNFIGNYKVNHRFSISLNTIYSTGRPITLPLAKYDLGGSERLYYSQRNQYRIPDYFRMDFSLNIEGNHKIKKLAHSSWTVGVYNLLGRKNPYSVYFQAVDGKIQGYKLSIFGQPIPTVTYNFRF
jgi:hypothetical protein